MVPCALTLGREPLPKLLPGAHVAIFSTEPDLDGFHARQSGLEFRDSLLVLSPGITTRFILLFRKSIESQTVAEQVLVTGTGGININACRVRVDPVRDASQLRTINRNPRQESGEQKWGLSKDKTDYPEVISLSGRWPPNVLMVHGSKCRKVGTSKILGHKGYPNGPGGKSRHWHEGSKRSSEVRPNPWSASFTNSDGLETVAAWNCQEDCPVRLLDEQSGERPSTLTGRADSSQRHELPRQHRRHDGNATRFTHTASDVYADAGGASRFFPQFKDDYELVAWVRTLITPDPSSLPTSHKP